MPQMSPIMWEMLNIYSFSLILLISLVIYYYKFSLFKVKSSNFVSYEGKLKNKLINWSW